MKRKKTSPKGVDPVTIALAGLLLLASYSSYRVWHHTHTVIDTIQTGEGLALIVTDKGIMSDSAKDEASLSSATKGLVDAQTESIILAISCAGIGVALGIRTFRQSTRL
jgi:hypothetical protein